MLNVKAANQATTQAAHDFQFPVDTKVAWIRLRANDGRYLGFMFAAIGGIEGTIGTGSNSFTFDAGEDGQEFWFTPTHEVDLTGVTQLTWEVEFSDWTEDNGAAFNEDIVIPDDNDVNLTQAVLVAPVGSVSWDTTSGAAPSGGQMAAFGYRDGAGEHWCLSLGYRNGALDRVIWSTTLSGTPGELPDEFLNPLVMTAAVAAAASVNHAYNGTSAPR